MSKIDVNQVTYHAEVTGAGPPLLLLHGFTGCSRNWDEIVPRLASDFRVIRLDILGHGQTDAPPDPARYQMEKGAADVTAVVSQILTAADEKQFHLAGYSMGGRLALYIAVHYPHLIRSLTLESSSPGRRTAAARTARRQRDNALADRIEREGIKSFVAFWENLPLWASQEQLPAEKRARLRQLRLQNNPVGLANSLRGMGTGVQPSLWPRLGELTMPVQLIVGELDHKFVALNREMAATIPTAQLTIVSGAGHTVHLERPLAIQKQLQQLRSHT